MPTLTELYKLKGLTASDRTPEEKEAIAEQMNYDEPIVETEPEITINNNLDTNSAIVLDMALQYKSHLDQKYRDTLKENEEIYGVNRNSINSSVNDSLDKIANEVSTHYKKYNGTDKLPLDDQKKKQLLAEYDARKATYGDQNADVWLDNQFKDIVGNNQSWFEQMWNATSHLIPAIEGGAIQTYGMIQGAIMHNAAYFTDIEGYRDNPDLNWFDSFVSDVIDNPITRYGRDVEMAGASNVVQGFENILGLSDITAADRIAEMRNTATKYNPEGLGADAIITTLEQDDTYFNSTTPWQALQSGGFTLLSMLNGAWASKAANWAFKGLAKGAVSLHNANRIIKTGKGLERTLEGLKKAQNFTNIAVIPGAVGSVEGALEGLNTKIAVEREGIEQLDSYYMDLVDKEAEELYKQKLEEFNPDELIRVDSGDGMTFVQKPAPTKAEVYKEVWDKYQDQYVEARRQIAWASEKAGIHNFWANSFINGMMNTTLKAGLMSDRVQESLRNFRLTGWAFNSPKFKIDASNVVTSKMGKAGTIAQILKEPLGEGFEEYSQSITDKVFSDAAQSNITSFIKNKFEGDGTAKVTDSFSSDYAAALTAFTGALTDKESIESAIIGAVSSVMGTAKVGRGYHRDDKGNIVQNSLFDVRNFQRGLNSKGEQESISDYIKRVTPWRSGVVSAYNQRKQEIADAQEVAQYMTEWLQDPNNKARWDGMAGTANWLHQMEIAAESNDQFGYRTAQMGKAINDVIMLSKLKGTKFYDSIITDLQKSSSGKLSEEEVQAFMQNGSKEFEGMSEMEVVERIQSNANKMLGLMSTVEKESKRLDSILGRIDDDTKQSLVFGKIMEQDFMERRDQLKEEIDFVLGKINSSPKQSNVSIDDDLKQLILEYGSINKAFEAYDKIADTYTKTEKRIEELENIDSKKRSDEQNETLKQSKKQLKYLGKIIQKKFTGLFESKGKKKDFSEVDTNLKYLVLNEREIMNLDPITRAMVLAQGANKHYNALHQDRVKIDNLNLEIDDLNNQIATLEAQQVSWTNSEGKVRKGHNKQYQRNVKKLDELKKEKDSKLRALNHEQGQQETKPVYNSAQQEVIDNLIQQGTQVYDDFIDKVVDMGRLEKSIKDYHSQYQEILSDPNAFYKYVKKAEQKAAIDLLRRRAERVANIEDYQEYAQELDRLTVNASDMEAKIIMSTLREASERQKKENNPYEEAATVQILTNYDKYIDNLKQQHSLVRQFANYPSLTDNDQSLLLNAMQYLASKGVDITDRDAAVQTLLEEDESGILGGKFRQYVESKNSMLSAQQRAFMPHFTSIGQIVNQYVDILNSKQSADEVQKIMTPKVSVVSDESKNNEEKKDVIVINPPSSTSDSVPVVNTNTNSNNGHFIDSDGTVSTTAQTTISQQNNNVVDDENKSELQKLFEGVTTSELAMHLSDSSGKITNSIESDEAKNTAMQYLEEIAVTAKEKGIFYNSIEELMSVIKAQSDRLLEEFKKEEDGNNTLGIAGGLLKGVYDSLGVKRTRGGGRSRTLPLSPKQGNPKSNVIHTLNIATLQKDTPNAWEVTFSDNHDIDNWLNKNWLKEGGPNAETNVYIMTNSEWAESNGGETPLIAVVQVEEPSNPDKTTAIPLNGLWYQPIGILPNSNSLTSGAEHTEKIRSLAIKDGGLQLITQDGLPNSSPLITHIIKVAAHDPDDIRGIKRENISANNNDVSSLILDFLPSWVQASAQTQSREELLEDDEYKKGRNDFLNHLEVIPDEKEGKKAVYVKGRLSRDSKGKEEEGPKVQLYHKKMEETKDRNTGKKTLKEVLENGSDVELHDFNSRTQRVLDEIIVPLFLSTVRRSKGRDSAKVITKEDISNNPDIYKEEAQRLSNLLNGYDGTSETRGIKGIKDFIYVANDWKFVVVAPSELQVAGNNIEESTTQFKIYLQNKDNSDIIIELGTLTAGKEDMNEVTTFFRNLLWDSEDKQIRPILNWQVPYPDIESMNGSSGVGRDIARENIAQIVDDGILEVAASSLGYDIDTVELRNPFRGDGSIAYTNTEGNKPKVLNSDNASTPKPLGETPLAEGSIVTASGLTIEPASGVILEGKEGGSNRGTGEGAANSKLEEAKKKVEKIIFDSNQFKLSEDELYYYVEDKETGERIKYLRVTTVIGADESSEIWTPSYEEVYNKLKEKHPEINLTNFDYNNPSDFLNAIAINSGILIDKTELDRTIAELRTEYKHSKYKEWTVPSTAIGNSIDSIVRNFFSYSLKQEYPNVSAESLTNFILQLEVFKNGLNAQGITMVSEGIVAHGEVVMTDSEGNTKTVKVAGTLDLFGYDTQGNFYIFDMKTTRDHSDEKLEKERKKWSRQLSMYADLLKSKYGIDVNHNNLRIIPIDVTYDPPIEVSPRGPKYTTDDNGQLYTQYRGETSPMPFEDAKPVMRTASVSSQFTPGYTELKINWDNLSSEDQDVALSLENQLKEEGSDNFKPKEATIELPQNAGGVTALNPLLSLGLNPLIKSGVAERRLPSEDAKNLQLPDWDDLTDSQLNYLAELEILDSFSYNDRISDTEECEMLAQNMRCRGLL